ncbi:TPA: hypothetical protein QCY13_001647 [Bacillus paranthracis]|nr:hypothetical protein [Bacillus paranthracis]
MKTLMKETKAMEDILKVLEEALCWTGSFEELPYVKQGEVYHKLQLHDEIESGNITDVEKATKWLELIELVNEWAHDENWDFEHTLIFDEGTVGIFSTYGDYQDEFFVDFVDGKLLLDGETLESFKLLDGEDLNSIITLMNMIEFNITINA